MKASGYQIYTGRLFQESDHEDEKVELDGVPLADFHVDVLCNRAFRGCGARMVGPAGV